MTLPMRRSATSVNPSPASARFTAAPWTSRMPGLSRTSTRILATHALDHPPVHLLVGVLHAAQILAEAVLVELRACPGVPEAARVGRDLIPEKEPPVCAAELQFEIHEHEAAPEQQRPQHAVDPQRRTLDPAELLRRCQPHHPYVLVVDHRVAEGIGLVVQLDDRRLDRCALLEPRTLGQAARDDVAHD